MPIGNKNFKGAKETKTFSFLVMAAGKGSRIGGTPKQFELLGDENREGKALWRWSAETAVAAGAKEIILTLPPELAGLEALSLGGAGLGGASGPAPQVFPSMKPGLAFKLAFGGPTRTDSVRNALAACSKKHDYVMVHDAARPFVEIPLLRRLMEAVEPDVGVVPLLPVPDALKRVDAKDGSVAAVDREGLYVTQTPQCFFRETLIKILAEGHEYKDEAEAWLAAGLKLRSVEGGRLNFKVTWPEDLEIAAALADALDYGETWEKRRKGKTWKR